MAFIREIKYFDYVEAGAKSGHIGHAKIELWEVPQEEQENYAKEFEQTGIVIRLQHLPEYLEHTAEVELRTASGAIVLGEIQIHNGTGEFSCSQKQLWERLGAHTAYNQLLSLCIKLNNGREAFCCIHENAPEPEEREEHEEKWQEEQEPEEIEQSHLQQRTMETEEMTEKEGATEAWEKPRVEEAWEKPRTEEWIERPWNQPRAMETEEVTEREEATEAWEKPRAEENIERQWNQPRAMETEETTEKEEAAAAATIPQPELHISERSRRLNKEAEKKPVKNPRVQALEHIAQPRHEGSVARQQPESLGIGQQLEASSMEQTTGNPRSAMELTAVQEDKWSHLSSVYPHLKPFSDNREFLELGPNDFVIFNSKYYSLINNSFMLHGYFHYGQLVLCRLQKKGKAMYYLGTPGLYLEREKQVAIMYGFESFECDTEPANEGDFGYYMMRVEL